ncbi:hypothetical protein [Cronobacter sakazakii]|uniref:hypothetical protein n=1 Tax=Cronobacter sakazakii TaxID=28141 RepID=UPI003D806706
MFNSNKSLVVIIKVSALAVALVVAGCSNQGVKTDKITYHTSPAPAYKDLSTFPKNNSWLAEIHTQKVPVDVDTAANRLKKYYKFPSTEEVAIATRLGIPGAISSGVEWSSVPGKYYRMGRTWNETDHLTIRMQKVGTQTEIVTTYMTYNVKNVSSGELKKLWDEINDVATNEIAGHDLASQLANLSSQMAAQTDSIKQ